MSDASDCAVAPAVGTVVDRLSRPQHGDAVGDGHHLVQLVRDEDDRPSLGGDLAQRQEQRVGLLRREHRGRLVEDEDTRVLVEGVEDLDALLLADTELPHVRVRVDRQVVALAERAHLGLDGARVDPEAAAGAALVAEHEILGDGEPLDEPEVLVHHAHAGVDRVAGRGEGDALAGEHRSRPRPGGRAR